jgi:hypothetical protein
MGILTAEALAERKVKNGLTRSSRVYLGGMNDVITNNSCAKMKIVNVDGSSIETDELPFKVTSKSWMNSEGRFQLLRDMKALQDVMKNAAPNVPSDTLATYFAKLFIDVTRQADDLADYSDMIYTVLSRPDAQEVTYLRDLVPYVGKEKQVSGANDMVPLIEANLANQASITQTIKAFGWKSNLHNMLFLPIDELSRITQAAAIINVDSRNADIIGYIVGRTFPALQSQAADSTSGASYDELMYNTFRKGIKTLGKLKHPLTGRLLAEIGAFSGALRLICHPADAWSIERIIRGELASAGGVRMIASALPISDIIAYGGGIMNGQTWGKEILSLPGVTQGTAYLYLPNQLGGFVLDKRTQTMEVGTGSVLQLSTEERAWYRVNGLYHDWFLGGAKDNTNNGLGCIVKITLPTES